MTTRFEYGTAHVRDLQVQASTDKKGEVHAHTITLAGRPARPSKRFWNSLHLRFGFTANIFRYFGHAEVFQRISAVAADDTFRYCLAQDDEGLPTLLAVSSPGSAVIRHDDLTALLDRHGAEQTTYRDGVVTSRHAPRLGSTFAIAGDSFQNKFVLQTPVDGFGKPSVYLSLLRLICSNGAVAYSPVFRSELSLGRQGGDAEFALVRVLEGFNNEEGFAALRQRFEAGCRSWASVAEVNRLYRTLGRLSFGGRPFPGTDGAAESAPRAAVVRAFHQMTGNLPEIYGLANLDALSVKRQRTLPAACKVYDLLNFASEVATHHAHGGDGAALQSYLGDLVSGEYDLEGTVDHFGDWKDFFVGSGATTDTLAALHRRGT